jgi:hypothetical protein
VGVPAGGCSLHVYRLAHRDWLVSEVGRGNEGRGKNLTHALAALSAGVSPPDWWGGRRGGAQRRRGTAPAAQVILRAEPKRGEPGKSRN